MEVAVKWIDRRRPIGLRDVLVFTLPPVMLAVYALVSPILDYHRISQYHDRWSMTARTDRFAKARVRTALRLPRTIALERELTPEDTSRGALHLLVNRQAWDAVQSAPQEWGRSVDAEVVRGGDLHPVEMRLRGDTSVHWTTEKKTVQLKTSKDDLLLGLRRLVFSVKEPLGSYVVHALARHVDLLTPETDVVPVYLNGRFHGITRATTTVDEGFLRREELLPGNIFRGEVDLRGERFKSQPNNLFANPLIWDRSAKNDRPGAGEQTLTSWLRDLNGGTPETHRRFMSRMDREELALLFAFLLVVGDPFHMDETHNQFWYEDPSSGRLRPIVWDIGLHDLQFQLETKHLNHFWHTVLRDRRVFARSLALLQRWAESGELVAHGRALVDDVWNTHRAAIELDLLRSNVIPPLHSPNFVGARLQRNLDYLAERIREARVGLAITRTAPGAWIVDVQTRSWVGVRLTGHDAEGSASALFMDTDANGVVDETEAALPFDGFMPGALEATGALVVAPAHYRWVVRTAPDVTELEVTLVNAITGAPAIVEPWAPGELVPETTSWHPWRYGAPEDPTPDIRWEGDVHLAEDVVIPVNAALVLAPGTRVSLEPDVSIIVRGRLLAHGTEEAPILFERATDLPWGTLALQGEGANGSRLTHARITGGGGALIDRVEYKGMVSVHHARDVRFENCELALNVRCDDALNAINAEVDLVDCHFHDTNADAIDYDISTGLIQGCTIERAGNDGLDLMTCRPTILGNVIRECADKGISVGENATPLIANNEIVGCDIGIEVKDGSRPLILHGELRGNRIGLLARRKNWRYTTGGWPWSFAA